MRTKLISIVLLAALVAPAILTALWMKTEQRQIRRAVKWKLASHVDDVELVRLVFSLENVDRQLRWKHDKEFEFADEMYDVVSRDTVDGKVILFCWPDHEETALNKRLQHTVALLFNHSTEKQESDARLIKFIRDLYFQGPSLLSNIDNSTASPSSLLIRSYCSRCNSPASPPPKLV